MAFRIRSSKFRHVYGKPYRKEHCYENVRLTRNAHDSSFCDVNPHFIAIVTESAGGGSFIVLPIDRTGRLDVNAHRVCGHAGAILDVKWNPFDDHIIASGSEDTTVKVWQIPEKGLDHNLSEWQVDLHGHQRRVAYIDWHPTAENIILSAGLDYKCILWNVEQAEPVNMINCHSDTIHSISWNREGSLFSTTSKDKKLRIIDPRSGECAMETGCHMGTKGAKSVFIGDTNCVLTTGFSQTSERQLAIWDIRNISQPINKTPVDTSNGVLVPFYDHDTKVAFIAGKGDGNIRYYEIVKEAPCVHYLNEYMSPSPQRGLGVMPKRGCESSKCEIMRFYKLHAARNFVEPISMIVPRKSDLFQEDLFPPTASSIASLTADEWISGQNREPILISMKDGQVTNTPKHTASKAVHRQDGALDQPPTITTYKAVSRSATDKQPVQRADTMPADVTYRPKQEGTGSTPASVKNIKRLSTNEEFVSIGSDKKFVNDKITAFENKNTSTENAGPEVVSPKLKNIEKKVWSPTSSAPPDLIANGLRQKSESDLRKAYFRQVEEIKSLKEQISLKDKRINQLEDEMKKLREIPSAGPGESDC